MSGNETKYSVKVFFFLNILLRPYLHILIHSVYIEIGFDFATKIVMLKREKFLLIKMAKKKFSRDFFFFLHLKTYYVRKRVTEKSVIFSLIFLLY